MRIKTINRQWLFQLTHQILPCIRTIKNLKHHYPKQHIFFPFCRIFAIYDILEQILTYPICCTVNIREFKGAQYRIIRPTRIIRPLTFAPKDIHPLLHKIEIIPKRLVIWNYSMLHPVILVQDAYIVAN